MFEHWCLRLLSYWKGNKGVIGAVLPIDNLKKDQRSVLNNILLSMTTLLTHTVAHSTKPSFMPKTNKQPPKKFLSLLLS